MVQTQKHRPVDVDLAGLLLHVVELFEVFQTLDVKIRKETRRNLIDDLGLQQEQHEEGENARRVKNTA